MTTLLHLADCRAWFRAREPRSVHAVVTDPPFRVSEFSDAAIDGAARDKGVWRQPPAIGGSRRAPQPRFTAMTARELAAAADFFAEWAAAMRPALVPGAHVFVASTPLLMHLPADALARAGLQRRGVLVRVVRTLRGGDRPKNHEAEYPGVATMARGVWEPWLIFREPFDGTVADCLARWGTGALRREAGGTPLDDVVESERTPKREREIAPHPSLKPQSFCRRIARAALPLGRGVLVDPFMGGGAVVAAAAHEGVDAEGVERHPDFFAVAERAVGPLSRLDVRGRP